MSDPQTHDPVQGEERLADRYARFVIRRRRFFIFSILALTLILSWFIKDLDIRNDPDTLLPPSNCYVATNAYTERHFGMGNLWCSPSRSKRGTSTNPGSSTNYRRCTGG